MENYIGAKVHVQRTDPTCCYRHYTRCGSYGRNRRMKQTFETQAAVGEVDSSKQCYSLTSNGTSNFQWKHVQFHPTPVRYVVALVFCMFVTFFAFFVRFLYFVAVFLSTFSVKKVSFLAFCLFVTLLGFFLRFFFAFQVFFPTFSFFSFLY